MKKALIYWFAFLFTLLWMTSCGTRNTKKTEVKEEVKTEIEASTKVQETIKTETKTETKTAADVVEQNENLSPVDPTKPMTKTVEEKDGKKITTYENANVSSVAKTDRTTKAETKQENSTTDSKVEAKIKASEDIEKSYEVKATESDKGFALSWWMLLLLVPIALWKIYDIRK